MCVCVATFSRCRQCRASISRTLNFTDWIVHESSDFCRAQNGMSIIVIVWCGWRLNCAAHWLSLVRWNMPWRMWWACCSRSRPTFNSSVMSTVILVILRSISARYRSLVSLLFCFIDFHWLIDLANWRGSWCKWRKKKLFFPNDNFWGWRYINHLLTYLHVADVYFSCSYLLFIYTTLYIHFRVKLMMPEPTAVKIAPSSFSWNSWKVIENELIWFLIMSSILLVAYLEFTWL